MFCIKYCIFFFLVLNSLFMIQLSFYLAVLLFYTDICQKIWCSKWTWKKIYPNQRQISQFLISQRNWKTEFNNPFSFYRDCKRERERKQQTSLILRGLKELFTQKWKHFIYSSSCQMEITVFFKTNKSKTF